MLQVNCLKKTMDYEIVSVKNGEETVLVIHKHEMTLIASTRMFIKKFPFVKYLHFHESSHEAHDDMLRIMGELLLEQPDSKYFDTPRFEEHMYNGLGDGYVISPEHFTMLTDTLDEAERYYKDFCRIVDLLKD